MPKPYLIPCFVFSALSLVLWAIFTVTSVLGGHGQMHPVVMGLPLVFVTLFAYSLVGLIKQANLEEADEDDQRPSHELPPELIDIEPSGVAIGAGSSKNVVSTTILVLILVSGFPLLLFFLGRVVPIAAMFGQ